MKSYIDFCNCKSLLSKIKTKFIHPNTKHNMNWQNVLKYSLIILILHIISVIGIGQDCYKVIANMNGLDNTSFLPDLETKACEIRDTLPTDFQASFGVFDFGFYRISQAFQGGYDDVWQNAIALAGDQKDYYIVFGRETTPEGMTDVNFRVKIKLPNTGQLSCIDESTITSTELEMVMILNQEGKSYHVKEIEAMQAFNEMIQRTKNCCDGSREDFFFDPLLMQIQVFIQDCNNKYSPENSIAVIVDNKMPEISFRLYYPPESASKICSKFKVYFTIQFKKTTNVKARDRDDLVTLSPFVTVPYYEVKLNDFVPIDFKEVMQGGRALIEVRKYDDDTLIKSFNFTIKGQNPKIGEVFKLMDQSPYKNAWFLKKIAIKETGSSKTDASKEMKHFNSYDSKRENLKVAWSDYSRCPNFNKVGTNEQDGDGGVGMMQLTNPKPSSNALWDWKQNIKDGYDELKKKRSFLIKFGLLSDVEAANDWNNEQLNDYNKVDKISVEYGGITWEMGASSVFGNYNNTISAYFNVPLATGERSFLDACLLLAYNGYGGTKVDGEYKNFLKLNIPTDLTKKPYWTTKDNQNNYVKKISEQKVSPSY